MNFLVAFFQLILNFTCKALTLIFHIICLISLTVLKVLWISINSAVPKRLRTIRSAIEIFSCIHKVISEISYILRCQDSRLCNYWRFRRGRLNASLFLWVIVVCSLLDWTWDRESLVFSIWLIFHPYKVRTVISLMLNANWRLIVIHRRWLTNLSLYI